MALNIVVHPNQDPRIVEVPSPATSAALQDIVDAVRSWEDSSTGINYPSLIDAAGKEELGGGVQVGITATLQNTQLMFEARTDTICTGTATTTEATGKTLTDTSATFITDGVSRGDTVYNTTTWEFATVLTVDSETQLTSLALSGDGASSGWTSGDTYRIYTNQQCGVTGGNLVAVDGNGNEMAVMLESPHVSVVRTSSSSATIAALEIENLQRIIESLRRQPGYGNIWYLDPINGNDANPGDDYNVPVKTFNRAISLAVDGNHDIIFALDTSGQDTFVVDEQFNINKRHLSIRGPGRSMQIIPTATTGSTVVVAAEGVSLENFYVKAPSNNTDQHAIHVQNHNCHLQHIWAHGAGGYNVLIDNAKYFFAEHCDIEHGDIAAIRFQGSTSKENEVRDSWIWSAPKLVEFGDGASQTLFREVHFHDATTGFDISSGCTHLYVAPSCTIHNVTTPWNNNGGSTNILFEEALRDDILLSVLQLREGNAKRELISATSENATRKVAVGKLDRLNLYIKEDTDADWSSPVSTKTLYFWYDNLGDDNPSKVGESD